MPKYRKGQQLLCISDNNLPVTVREVLKMSDAQMKVWGEQRYAVGPVGSRAKFFTGESNLRKP